MAAIQCLLGRLGQPSQEAEADGVAQAAGAPAERDREPRAVDDRVRVVRGWLDRDRSAEAFLRVVGEFLAEERVRPLQDRHMSGVSVDEPAEGVADRVAAVGVHGW